MCCSHNPAKSNIPSHLSFVGRILDSSMSGYDNCLVIGDLNSETSEMTMSEFCETYNLQNLVIDSTCCKNPSKPTYIDLILSNFPNTPKQSRMVHKLSLIVPKTHFPRLKRNSISYRDYKSFLINYFRSVAKLTVQTQV